MKSRSNIRSSIIGTLPVYTLTFVSDNVYFLFSARLIEMIVGVTVGMAAWVETALQAEQKWTVQGQEHRLPISGIVSAINS